MSYPKTMARAAARIPDEGTAVGIPAAFMERTSIAVVSASAASSSGIPLRTDAQGLPTTHPIVSAAARRVYSMSKCGCQTKATCN